MSVLLTTVLGTAACAGGDGSQAGRGSGSTTASSTTSSAAPSGQAKGVLASTDGRTTTVAAKVDVGGSVCGVAVVGGTVWVTDNKAGELVKVDAAAGRVVARYPVSAKPCELEAAAGSIWVTTQSGVVDRVDPATGKVLATVTQARRPTRRSVPWARSG